MASAGEGEVEYESDPEEEKRLLSMRRRQAASDDEDVDDRRIAEAPEDDESDGQGGVEEYDENDDVDDGEYVDEYEEEEVEEEGYGDDEGKADEELKGGNRSGVDVRDESNGDGGEVDGGEGKKGKENEPFAVPTAGAFYMHDDRFRDNAAGRGWRLRGGRRLWESKDDHRWGHDKFEEMTMQERQYVERRKTSRGRSRGRGKSRGRGRGGIRGSRSGVYVNINDQNQASKSIRDRGPRRHEHTTNNNHAFSSQNRQSGKSTEKNVRTSSGSTFTPAVNVGSDQVPAKKQVFASSLNYASPPFYPSGSSGKGTSMTQKGIQPFNKSRVLSPDAIGDNIPTAPNSTLLRRKNVADSVGMERLYINDSPNQPSGKPLANLQMQPLGSSVATYSRASKSQFQGKSNTGQMTYQPVQVNNQVSGVSICPGSTSRTSSPSKSAPSVNSSEANVAEFVSELNKSMNSIVGKGKGSQGSGGGSFVYSGAQIIGTAGNMGVGHSDPNFSAAPTFLPVMQFGGQHPGRMGVPAFGMAFPGYVGGNSEMTWLPVLAGAAGALGSAYCPPQVAVDGSYNPRPSGQTSSMESLNKETNTSKSNNELKTSERDENVTDEVRKRQNKPRRYSEMNFGQ